MKMLSKFFALVVIGFIFTAYSYGQNYKIKQSTSMMGQNIASTVYVKGSRKRTEQGGIMGIGGDVANIEQCDMRRTIQVNDKKRLYTIEPFATDDSTPSAPVGRPGKPIPQKTTKGGTVTMTTSINDTGERKQMFGLTARHIKMSMTMQPSADACTKQSMNMESDGWYVDLPQFSCPMTPSANPMGNAGMQSSGGCRDRIVVKSSGGARLGFALKLTQTMNNQGQSFSTSLDTLEFSKAALEDALFDIPTGYSLAASTNDLYGKPDYTAMAQAAKNNQNSRGMSDGGFGEPEKTAPVKTAKRAGTKRIGVLIPTSQSTESLSTRDLQSFLVRRLTGPNLDAVAVTSEAEARASGCDYILSNDFSKMKQSSASKIGGMFGKVTNTDTGSRSYDAQVDFKLTSLSDGQTVMQNKASVKTSGNSDSVAQTALSQEASLVLATVR